jgi:hypothetical protein
MSLRLFFPQPLKIRVKKSPVFHAFGAKTGLSALFDFQAVPMRTAQYYSEKPPLYLICGVAHINIIFNDIILSPLLLRVYSSAVPSLCRVYAAAVTSFHKIYPVNWTAAEVPKDE